QRPADLRGRGGREDLVGDDHRPLPGTDLLGEPVPRTQRLPLQTAPGQLHQVEGGEEVGVEPVGGVEDPPLGERLATLEEQVLQEGGARLRRTDVHQDLPCRGAHLPAPPPAVPPPVAAERSWTRWIIRTAAATESPARTPRPAVDGRDNADRSPWTVTPDARTVSTRRSPAAAAHACRRRGSPTERGPSCS